MRLELSVRTAARIVIMAISIAVFLFLLTTFDRALILIFISLILAFTINPLVSLLERRKLKLPQAIFVSYFFFVILLGLLAYFVLPSALEEAYRSASQAPTWIKHLENSNSVVGHLMRRLKLSTALKSLSKTSASKLEPLVGDSFKIASQVFSIVLDLVLIVFTSALMLFEKKRIDRWLRASLQEKYLSHYSSLLKRIQVGIGRYVSLSFLASLLIAVVLSLILLFTGSKLVLLAFFLLLVTGLVPYFSTIANCVIMFLLELHNGFPAALIVLGATILFNFLESHTLRPYIYGKTMKISPLAILVFIFSFEAAFGILGAILSIPVLVILEATGRELLDLGIHRRFLTVENPRDAEELSNIHQSREETFVPEESNT